MLSPRRLSRINTLFPAASLLSMGLLVGACASDSRDPETGGMDVNGDDIPAVPNNPVGENDQIQVTNVEVFEDDNEDFSYIWISNSPEGTVSKIATATMVEEGRYMTRSDSSGNPSRTSVNLHGDAAVANRAGGVTKYYATKGRCKDKNSDGSIQTSTGKDNILAFEDEECVAWHTPMEYTSQRGIAWTANDMLWITGVVDGDRVDVSYLDGATGKVEKTIPIPGSKMTGNPMAYTAYGGAVDGGDNFWFHGLGDENTYQNNFLIRVDADDFSYHVYNKPTGSGYGITVDMNGRVWSCAAKTTRFDPSTEMWVTAVDEDGGELPTQPGGCMADGHSRLWVGGRGSGDVLYAIDIDIDIAEVVETWPVPEFTKGISIDFEGYVWGVSGVTESDNVYKIDPETGEWDVYGELTNPYTYSDMTAFALATSGELPPVL